MAGNSKATAMKKIRERAKAEKRKEKMLRREARKKAKEAQPEPQEGVDPDLAGIVPGPQRLPY
ncbi:MAG: hypothetical protein AB1515_03910 [Nitrospirota bacterium]